MKFLFDYFPIICFFVAYKLFGIYIATAATMLASFMQVGYFWLRHRRFEKIHVITLILVLLLGSSTLLFHNEIFIKWKPSIIYWVFAIVILGSELFTKKPLLQRMLSDKISMPIRIWRRLNISWGIFFILLGGLNLYVVYHYTTNSWVNFKLFGTLGLTLCFIIIQAFFISRFIDPQQNKPSIKS